MLVTHNTSSWYHSICTLGGLLLLTCWISNGGFAEGVPKEEKEDKEYWRLSWKMKIQLKRWNITQ
eukprot:13937047-Ditylum_brightwellii.AAC.1